MKRFTGAMAIMALLSIGGPCQYAGDDLTTGVPVPTRNDDKGDVGDTCRVDADCLSNDCNDLDRVCR